MKHLRLFENNKFKDVKILTVEYNSVRNRYISMLKDLTPMAKFKFKKLNENESDDIDHEKIDLNKDEYKRLYLGDIHYYPDEHSLDFVFTLDYDTLGGDSDTFYMNLSEEQFNNLKEEMDIDIEGNKFNL